MTLSESKPDYVVRASEESDKDSEESDKDSEESDKDE